MAGYRRRLVRQTIRAVKDALFLLAGGAVSDLAVRVAQVALPLVILAETGSVAATGLVAGAAGLPVLLSPWWARRARQWVDSGRRLSAVAVLEAFALAVVPAAASLGRLDVVVLAASGLLLGFAEALSQPGRSALLADIGDRTGPDRAVLLLTWQDGLRRLSMIAGPPLGAVAVTAGFELGLLWQQAAVVLVVGLLAWPVRGRPAADDLPAPSIRAALATRPDVLRGWIVRGAGCVTWFAFPLGLSVIGVERGRPGVYLAAGMSGYGVGAVTGTVVTVAVVRRWPPMAIAGSAWSIVGLGWFVMGVRPTLPVVATVACVVGVACVLGIAAITAVITRTSSGAERRALLSGQTVVVNAGGAAGMLLGGPLLALIGAAQTLCVTGLLTIVISLTVVACGPVDVRKQRLDSA